jgi:hypothetical protein
MLGKEPLFGNSARTALGLELESAKRPTDPSPAALMAGLVIAFGFVFLTRLPVARPGPLESDEIGFLAQTHVHWFPMHHTLFMTAGRLLGAVVGNAYGGFLLLDMITSGLALVAAWWWLRALVPPATAAGGALVLGVAPIFWGYGAMAANYTSIVAVGAFLLGVACRTRCAPEPWHPIAAAVVLALGTGYRQDIGTFWLPVLLVILWLHRWRGAILAGLIFTVLNLAWLLAMLHDVGGWSAYRARNAEYAYQAGYLNSVWNLGLVDASLRYAVKLAMALLWTIGPCLLFAPRGLLRLTRSQHGPFTILVLCLSIFPALGTHLLVQFGSQGYSFHYIPALLALAAIGIGGTGRAYASAPLRLVAISALMASLFLLYPTDFNRPGWRGDFDLSFARLTRIGLRTSMEGRQPRAWRTANSRVVAGVDRRERPAAAPSL